jgi:hypothetical protein
MSKARPIAFSDPTARLAEQHIAEEAARPRRPKIWKRSPWQTGAAPGMTPQNRKHEKKM